MVVPIGGPGYVRAMTFPQTGGLVKNRATLPGCPSCCLALSLPSSCHRCSYCWTPLCIIVHINQDIKRRAEQINLIPSRQVVSPSISKDVTRVHVTNTQSRDIVLWPLGCRLIQRLVASGSFTSSPVVVLELSARLRFEGLLISGCTKHTAYTASPITVSSPRCSSLSNLYIHITASCLF